MSYILPVFLAQRVDIKEALGKPKSWVIIHSTVKTKYLRVRYYYHMLNASYKNPIKSDMMNSSWSLTLCYFWNFCLYIFFLEIMVQGLICLRALLLFSTRFLWFFLQGDIVFYSGTEDRKGHLTNTFKRPLFLCLLKAEDENEQEIFLRQKRADLKAFQGPFHTSFIMFAVLVANISCSILVVITASPVLCVEDAANVEYQKESTEMTF